MKPLLALTSAFLFALASPAMAQDEDETPDVPDFAEMSGEELVDSFRSGGDRWLEEPCEFGEPLLTALSGKVPENPGLYRSLKLAQIFCADEQEEYEKGAAYIAEVEAKMPGAISLGLALYFDRQTKNADGALTRLKALDFDAAEDLSARTYWPVARMIEREGKVEQLNDLALEWSQNGIFGALELDLQSGLSIGALEAAARQERTELAGDLLDYVRGPRNYITLLTRRKYQAIWPIVEERAGPNLTNVGERNVELTMTRLGNSPTDRDRFSAAAYALHFNGQFEDAIALADRWQKREERGLALEEGDAWALNIQAYAYDSLGQPVKADAVFDRLAQVDPEENNWVVSFVINRASRLVGQGRWEEGLAAAALARTVPGSTFAEMIVAKDHACALKKLGRADEAASELEFLRENADESPELTAQGLMCHDLNDEAAQLLLDAFADPAKRDRAIAAFDVGPLDLFYTQSILPNPADLLEDYPKLAAELAKYVRPMPEAFIPQAALKRVKLDLPSWD